MSFKENFVRAKKAIIMGVLAVAAVIPSVKGQTTEEKTASDTATTVASETAKRKEMLESAIRTAAAPREEIAKYIDFPPFIPVTKDGKFDKEKAEKWSEILTPYLKVLAEKRDKVTAVEAYKAFKDAIGQKNVSLKDFEQICKIAEEGLKRQKFKIPESIFFSVLTLAAATAALAMGAGAFSAGWMTVDDFHDFRQNKKSLKFLTKMTLDVFSVCITGAASGLFGYAAAVGGSSTVQVLKETPKQGLQGVYEGMYFSHIDQTILTQKKQFKQDEHERAVKFRQDEFEGAMRQIKGIQK